MKKEEASIIIGNIPINGDGCYSISEYQQAKAIAIQSLEAWEKVKEEIKSMPNIIYRWDAVEIIDKHLSEVSE